jgi:hypothetical protein
MDLIERWVLLALLNSCCRCHWGLSLGLYFLFSMHGWFCSRFELLLRSHVVFCCASGFALLVVFAALLFLLQSLPRFLVLPALGCPSAIASAGYMCDFNFYFH